LKAELGLAGIQRLDEAAVGGQADVRADAEGVGVVGEVVEAALGATALAKVSALDMQALYRELLDRGLSARSIRYTNWVLRSALKQAVGWNLFCRIPQSLGTMVASA
jgi:hypothetical protein